MPDDLESLRQEFLESLCLKHDPADCVCANDPDVDPCECGHPLYRHWNYGGLSGCIDGCKCECYVAGLPPKQREPAKEPRQPLPRAHLVNGTWWERFRRFFEWS